MRFHLDFTENLFANNSKMVNCSFPQNKIKMKLFLTLFLLIFSLNSFAQNDTWLLKTPAGNRFCEINSLGETVIPNGRIIKPLGKTYRIAPHPYGLVMSPDGKTIITANSGTNPFSISILQNIFSENPIISQIPKTAKTDDDLLAAVFMGVCVSPDNRYVYVAGGQTNKIHIFEIQTNKKVGTIDCGGKYNDAYIGEMVMTKDGSKIYAVDQIGFRMLVIDVLKKQVIDNIPTGRYPFGITLSPDEKKIFVANVGMFEYSFVKGTDPKNPKETYLKKPAFGYNTKEMKEGTKIGNLEVPALGDPNAPESFSVWAYQISDKITNIAKIKTGVLVGEKIEGIPAVGGSSPNSIVATDQYVFVSNANNDNISVIDILSNKIIQHIDLQIDSRLKNWKGIIPFGLALSPDNKRLYVAESGINAVGVVDILTMKVLGHLPVGWFPSKLAVSPDGKKLVVANAKGFGSGPNGGKNFKMGEEGSYIGSLMKGSVTVLDIPQDSELKNQTEKVIQQNFLFEKYDKNVVEKTPNPIPIFPKERESPIKYIVFISKENRTYDEVFGQLKNGNGDPALARYGKDQTFKNNAGNFTVRKSTVMPNHLALAKRFGTADNFYVDADHSADGHRWLSNIYPNEWVETHTSAAYGGKREYKPESDAPGRFAMTGSSGSFYPEDYNQDGSMWEHCERNGVSFYNFGFTTEQDAGSFNDSTLKVGGELYSVNYPSPDPMWRNTSWRFPTYNMAIPDQYRASVFMQEFNEKFMGEGKKMPQFLPLMLPNDHGAGERPKAGFPFRESYMADNDLALGRVVEFLSHTPYWKNMAIFVTEDDSQGGVDHVDAHRSILQVYSPFVKKNYFSHQHYSFGSLFKTFWNIFGIPYLNQYDAGATDLSDFFTNEADYTPYNAQAVDPRIFDPKKALTPIDEKFDWKALKETPALDDDDFLHKDREEEDKKLLEAKEFQSNPRLYKTKKKKK
jgi:YVTN family beta-propeller protein